MKVLFVSRHTGSRTFPLASASLAASLEHEFGSSVDCRILEFPPGFDIAEAAADILTREADVLALSVYSWSRDSLLELAAAVQNEQENAGPAPFIIAGGPEISNAGSLRHPAVDLTVSGEGEQTLVDIIRKLMNPELRRPEGHVSAGYIDSLDILPSPWKALDIAGRKWDDYVWELSRGCPFNCHFCYESRGSRKVRHKAMDQVAAELEELTSRGAETVFILDPTFNANPHRAVSLLELLQDRAPETAWHMEIRTEFLDDEQAGLYAELGCTLQIGLQTADESVAEGIGRPFSRDSFREKILLLHELGAVYGLDLIWGLPGDSLAGFRRSLDFALSCAPNHLDLFPLAVLPGTRLRDDARRRALSYRQQPPYTVTGSATFPEEDLEKAAELAEAAGFLYNECRAVPWFLIFCDILEIQPTVLIDQAAAILASGGKPRQEDRPAWLRVLVSGVSGETGDPAEILGDVVVVTTLESAAREGLPIPESLGFSFRPGELMNHLNMGIVDPGELAAFVSRQPGVYRITCSDDGLGFDGETT